MLAAAFTLAFFGLLQVSEFTVPSLREFDPRIHATNGSIHFSRNHYTFHLSRSKTDQYGHGYDVYIPQIGGKLCPHAAMINYLTEQGQTMQAAPLFVFTSGKPLTRNSCLKHLHHALGRIGYDPKNFNTHSFRIGARRLHHMLTFLPVLSRCLADGEVMPIGDTHARTDTPSMLQPPNLLTWHR